MAWDLFQDYYYYGIKYLETWNKYIVPQNNNRLFQKKIVTPPPIEDISGKFQGVDQKSLEFQGLRQKKNRYPQQEGYNISLEKSNCNKRTVSKSNKNKVKLEKYSFVKGIL